MAKTNPIGVRFRQDVLDLLKTNHKIDSPQKALVFMERFYCQHHKLAQDVTQVLRAEVKDLTKPTNVLKPHDEAKTNYSINTIPKTLDELKSRCPAELTGFDRSNWIAVERQKFGI